MKQVGRGLKFNDDTIDLQEELLNVISRKISSDDEEWLNNILSDQDQMSFDIFLKEYQDHRKNTLKTKIDNDKEYKEYWNKNDEIMKAIKTYNKNVTNKNKTMKKLESMKPSTTTPIGPPVGGRKKRRRKKTKKKKKRIKKKKKTKKKKRR